MVVNTDWQQTVKQYKDKVITTAVTRLLDDRIYCARSALTHLGLWRKLYDSVKKVKVKAC